MNTDVEGCVFFIPELESFRFFSFNQERSWFSQIEYQKTSAFASSMIKGQTLHLFHPSCISDLNDDLSFSADVCQGASL